MKVFGKTDIGCVRKENQDYFLFEVKDDMAFCVLCDGMGGANGGALASRLVCEAYIKELKRQSSELCDFDSIKNVVERAVYSANKNVFQYATKDLKYEGMGTTMVTATVKNNVVVISNVGDSRAYKISDLGIKKITRDHSLVEMFVEEGKISAEEAKRHPDKNIITKAVGTERELDADFYNPDMKNGDRILLCSDGLSNFLTDDELYSFIYKKDIDKSLNNLIDMAKDRGGSDNITAVILEI